MTLRIESKCECGSITYEPSQEIAEWVESLDEGDREEFVRFLELGIHVVCAGIAGSFTIGGVHRLTQSLNIITEALARIAKIGAAVRGARADAEHGSQKPEAEEGIPFIPTEIQRDFEGVNLDPQAPPN